MIQRFESDRQMRSESTGAGWMDRCQHEVSHLVEEAPASAMLVGFGVGMAVGLGIAAAMAVSNADHRTQRMAESLGHRIFESMHSAMPEGLRSRFAS